ncbi:HIT family protein [Paeniglutamicibacter psychrophenolicus]
MLTFMDEKCVFCEIASGRSEGHVVASNAHCVAFLDAAPINAGHTLVVPRKHLRDIHGLDAATSAAMFDLARRVADSLRDSTLPCEGVNLLMSNGEVAEQSVFHAHLHVIPRVENDGFAFVEPPAARPTADELAATARLLRPGR